jgi:DNA (cytosine-5)-methyltransferase 1
MDGSARRRAASRVHIAEHEEAGPAPLRYLSLFSGMEAAHLAWAELGWQCVAVAEIDAAAAAVLKHRLPDVPNLGNVLDITDAQIAALGHIDVVIGGSPCQDLSIAGKRKGLAGARSGLFHQQVRIFDAARSLCGARWLGWENVPGAFSSHKGRDFAVVVGTLAGLELAVPKDGWASEGVALGPRGLVEWGVLDAQWFGLAQRRKRVFAVLDTGNWASRSPVLLEPESLRGDSPPRREAWENVAGTLTPSALGGSSASGGDGRDGLMVPTISMCLNAGAMGRIDAESETLLVDANAFDTTQITHPENRCNPQPGDPCHPLAAAGHAPAIALGYRWAASSYESMSVDDLSPSLRASRNGETAVGVRRLTPRECERLQGAPDDWTLVPHGKRGAPIKDSPRYKMLGNSFAVNCVRWLGKQIGRAHRESTLPMSALR